MCAKLKVLEQSLRCKSEGNGERKAQWVTLEDLGERQPWGKTNASS